MKHPSEYSTIPYGSLRVMEVDAGTVITDERTGRSETVEDGTYVFKGTVVFCTKSGFEAIRAATLPTSGASHER